MSPFKSTSGISAHSDTNRIQLTFYQDDDTQVYWQNFVHICRFGGNKSLKIFKSWQYSCSKSKNAKFKSDFKRF